MKGMFEYKGFLGSVKYNEEDKFLYGKVEFIRDLIDYQGKSIEELEKAFKESVDDYLLTCEQLKKEPDKPFKGSFNVRISEDLHREAYCFAVNQNVSLNEVVSKAVKAYLEKRNQEKNIRITVIHQDVEDNPEMYSVGNQSKIFSELVGGNPEVINLRGKNYGH